MPKIRASCGRFPKKAHSAARAVLSAVPSPFSSEVAFAHDSRMALRCDALSAAVGPAVRHGLPRSSSRPSRGLASCAASSAARPSPLIALSATLSAVSERLAVPLLPSSLLGPLLKALSHNHENLDF